MRGVFLVALCLGGCHAPDLPDYWLCQGLSQQNVLSSSGRVIERYAGQEPLILERYGNSVFEFSAPAMFGLFVVCNDDSKELVFRAADCSQSRESLQYREGKLNLDTNSLHYTDRRSLPGKVVNTVADYQCHYLGHAYTFKDLEEADAH